VSQEDVAVLRVRERGTPLQRLERFPVVRARWANQ
jgi:hypothetical protein